MASTGIEITRIDPPNWWVGMRDSTLQLCIFGKNISACTFGTSYPGIKVVRETKPENPDYLFVDLVICPRQKPGKLGLFFSSSGKKVMPYTLLQRDASPNLHRGYSSKDLVYELMPDRFANGDSR